MSSASNVQEPAAPVVETVRLGVIGAGWFVSRRHLPDAVSKKEVLVTALCRRDREARARMAEHFHLPADCGYDDWQEMLDQAPLDAVLIATPNNQHYAQTKAALERGLHVLVEKPMTVSSTEARELAALAHEKNLKLSVALNPPFWAHCHRAKRALHSEVMGELESASMYWTGSAEHLFGKGPRPDNLPGVVAPSMYRADPEQNGGGYFIDGGSHLISELLWITGLRVRRVSAMMDELPLDMRACAILELENGALATVNSIGNSHAVQRRVRNVFGAANGTVTINHAEFETTVHIHGDELVKFRENDLPPVATPIANFVDAILGRTEIVSTGEHGAHVVEVVEAIYSAARSNSTVTLAASG